MPEMTGIDLLARPARPGQRRCRSASSPPRAPTDMRARAAAGRRAVPDRQAVHARGLRRGAGPRPWRDERRDTPDRLPAGAQGGPRPAAATCSTGRSTSARPRRSASSPAYPATVASYVDDALVVRAVVALRPAAVGHVGAALGAGAGGQRGRPRSRTDASTARSPRASREVCNIVASLFNVDGARAPAPARLPRRGRPAAARRAGPHPDARPPRGLWSRVAGYGSGRLAVVLL